MTVRGCMPALKNCLICLNKLYISFIEQTHNRIAYFSEIFRIMNNEFFVPTIDCIFQGLLVVDRTYV